MYQNVITEQIDGVLFVYFNCEGKVNVFNKQLMEELSDIVDNIADVEGVVFASKKSTFIAGADINEFFPLFEASNSEVVELISKGQTVFNNIEDLPIPTVAWINGAAMGGGAINTAFGGQGADKLLVKITSGLAVAFMGLAIIIGMMKNPASRIDYSNEPTLSRNKGAADILQASPVQLQPIEKLLPADGVPANSETKEDTE